LFGPARQSLWPGRTGCTTGNSPGALYWRLIRRRRSIEPVRSDRPKQRPSIPRTANISQRTPGQLQSLNGFSCLAVVHAKRFHQRLQPGGVPLPEFHIPGLFDRQPCLVPLAVQQVIPGKTSDADLARYLKQRMQESGVGDAWAPEQNPNINSGPDRGHSHATDKIIQPGDVIQTDFGIKVYDIWCTDIQRFAYVLKPDEREPPQKYKEYMRNAITGHRMVLAAMRPGVTGWSVDKVQRDWLAECGSLPIMWSTGHPVGYWAHDAGPSLGGAAYSTAALEKSQAVNLDLKIRGTSRLADHDMWWKLAGLQGRQVLYRGEVVGYYYLGKGTIGPVAWKNSQDAEPVLTLACHEAAAVAPELRMAVPGINHTALRFAFDSGMRLTSFANFLTTAPFGRMEQYLPSGPSLF